MRLRNWLFGQFDAVSRLFGFEMVEGPVLESEELFTRKAGEEIVGQLYNFEVHTRSGHACPHYVDAESTSFGAAHSKKAIQHEHTCSSLYPSC